MKRRGRIFCLSALALFCWATAATAEYTIVLKNGRRITVQSYREEGGMIKAYSLGGEIGIRKEQIQSILKGGESEEPGMISPRIEGTPARPVSEPRVEEKKESPIEPRARVSSPEEELKQERAREEKEYQAKVKEITQRIAAARERYLRITGGSSTPEAGLLNDSLEGWIHDLTSRLKDSQKLPISDYNPREREISDLRNQIDQLQKERDMMIEEMRQNDFDTGSLSLE